MKFCVIAPTSHLQLSTLGSGIHMALTHLTTESDEYVKFFQRMINKQEYVILDNSAFELEQQGKGLDPEPVLKAAKLIGASEVIATDVLCNGDATMASTRNFIKEFKAFFGEEIRTGRPVPKIMAVPQGKTPEEWLDCYTRLLYTENVDVLGFSKISVPTSFGGPDARKTSGGVVNARLKLIKFLDEKCMWPENIVGRKKIEIHLLGGDNWSGHELREVSKTVGWRVPSHPIRSNDTSAPVWYGAYGQKFDAFTGKAATFIGEKPDLENHRQTTAEMINKNMEAVLTNIAIFHKMAES